MKNIAAYHRTLRARRRAKRLELIQKYFHQAREHRFLWSMAVMFPRLRKSVARRIGIPLTDLRLLLHRVKDLDEVPSLRHMPRIN